MTDQNLRRLTLGILVLTTLCFGILVIPAGFAGVMSPMAFDSGISAAAVLFVLTLVSFPLVVLVSIPGSWFSYRKGTCRIAILLSLLPAINILVLTGIFIIY
jgi:hypothetical protein